MSWSHPDISIDDLLSFVKGFIDMVVLASGYQSSGELAIWDVPNIKKALQWGLFFEEVFKRLGESDDPEGSIREFDAALMELNSTSLVPQGLANLSSESLSRAGELMLDQLFQHHSLDFAHLLSLLTAVVEMDTSRICVLDGDNLSDYIDRLMVRIESLDLVSEKKLRHMNCSSNFFGSEESVGVKHSFFIIQELVKRQASISKVFLLKKGLDTLLKTVTRNDVVGLPIDLPGGGISLENKEIMTELAHWTQWRSRCLSYLLGDRTMKLLSGANLIFSAPKLQWARVFEALKASGDAHGGNFLEILEIVLLGFVSSRWSSMIEHFLSHSYNFLSVSQQYSDVHNFLRGSSRTFHLWKEAMSFKEKEIHEYMVQLLGTEHQRLWQLPPILVAAAIPSWSILFKFLLSEMEKQLNGTSPVRYCNCDQAGKGHRDCEVAGRIWCIYIFNV